jgi:hypothetical protein
MRYQQSLDDQPEMIKGLITGETYCCRWGKSYAYFLVAKQKKDFGYQVGSVFENDVTPLVLKDTCQL